MAGGMASLSLRWRNNGVRSQEARVSGCDAFQFNLEMKKCQLGVLWRAVNVHVKKFASVFRLILFQRVGVC